jgi:putative hydrolase of the HAD superfamily
MVKQYSVLFDLDDSLIFTHKYFVRAIDKTKAYLKMVASLDVTRYVDVLRTIELERIKSLGFAARRFPESLTLAYEQLAEEQSIELSPMVCGVIATMGWAVYDQPVVLKPGVVETLELLKAEGYTLHLLTKGDTEIQNRKIDKAGLRLFFKTATVVPDKTADVLREILATLELDPWEVVVVGDSLKSDILPALTVGASAIHIPMEEGSWSYEEADLIAAHAGAWFVKLDDIAQVPNLLKKMEALPCWKS